MAAIGNLAAADLESTPVTHTFEPVRTSADYAVWEDKSFSQYIGFWKVTMQLKRPQGNAKVASRNLEAIIRVETPVLETLGTNDAGITPAPTVSYRPMAEVKYTLPERSTLQQRKNLRGVLLNILGLGASVELVDAFRVPY